MSEFSKAIPQVLKNEGGYSLDPHDPGGETYRGITRKNFPNWTGWPYIDAQKPLKDEEIINNFTIDCAVREFYRVNFWETNQLDKINSQLIAGKVLDMCVNMGSKRGVMLLQQALDRLGLSLNEDGRMGPLTYNGANNQDETKLHQALVDVCVAFYTNLASKRPTLKKFLTGWLRRARQ